MKILLTIAALLVLAVPAASAAPPAGTDSKNPAKVCKAERGTTAQSITAFDDKYGKNANKKNAFGKCVSAKAQGEKDEKDEKDEAEEDEEKNDTEAAKKCKSERGTTAQSMAAFNEKHGTNKNKKNAFGKCVSKHSKSG